MIYEEVFAGNIIRYRFRYPGTERFLLPYITENPGDTYDILASEEHIESQRPYYPEDQEDAYVEYKSLIELTSRALLPHACCLFHAVAFLWNGYAWLITGPSGAGKTTQYKRWKITYRNAVEMICGDMPLLEWKEDDTIWVHPSPWNGKERIKGKVSAPLGGIVLLEQDEENSIRIMSAEDCGVPIFLQMAVRPETEEQILMTADLVNRLLSRYPVWRLENRGDAEAAMLTAQTFLKHIQKDRNNEI